MFKLKKKLKSSEVCVHIILFPRSSPSREKPGGTAISTGLLTRHLTAMSALSRAEGARFTALTYPFPGAHHRRVRDVVLDNAPARGVEVLDLYGHFDERFTDDEWRAMRTPEDHVNARGYREMGERLFALWFPEASAGRPAGGAAQ